MSAYQAPCEASPIIRSLAQSVPLVDAEPIAVEQFLQTRTVSLEEARGELESWRPAAEEELEALEHTTGAVERVTTSDVEHWVKNGQKVVQVPARRS